MGLDDMLNKAKALADDLSDKAKAAVDSIKDAADGEEESVLPTPPTPPSAN